MDIGLLPKWAAVALLTFGTKAAIAGSPLKVQLDQSQLMLLNTDPGSIIIGNPSIADVSLNGRQLFVHGHSFGETNLIILDRTGKKIGDYDVTVSGDSTNQLTISFANNKGLARHTYSCAPNCEANMVAGDESSFMQQTVKDNRTKYTYANGMALVSTDRGSGNMSATTAYKVHVAPSAP